MHTPFTTKEVNNGTTAAHPPSQFFFSLSSFLPTFLPFSLRFFDIPPLAHLLLFSHLFFPLPLLLVFRGCVFPPLSIHGYSEFEVSAVVINLGQYRLKFQVWSWLKKVCHDFDPLEKFAPRRRAPLTLSHSVLIHRINAPVIRRHYAAR